MVALEGCGLILLTGTQIVAIVGGDISSLATAIALAVMTLIGGVGVLAFSAAIWRSLSWGRSGGIVTQVLILAVALGAATGAYADPGIGLVIAIPALITGALLVIATRDAGRRARDAGSA